MSACSFTGPIKGMQWELKATGYQNCTGGMAPFLYAGTALAFWSTITMTIQIFRTFKSYRSLYFWSLIITSWALSLHAIGLLLMYVGNYLKWRAYFAILFIGWIGMTTGFSIVLYARLHLLERTKRWRRPLLTMVLTVGVVVSAVSITMERLPALPAITKHHRVAVLTAWGIWQRVRPWIFLVEDLIISSLYVKAALEYADSPPSFTSTWLRNNREMVSLLLMQLLVWMLDFMIVGAALARLFTLIDIMTSFVYAVKLRLEFAFLDQLVNMSKTTAQPCMVFPSDFDPTSIPVQHNVAVTLASKCKNCESVVELDLEQASPSSRN